MKPVTVATLDKLRAAAWFANVGKPIEQPERVRMVKSWREVFKWCSKTSWSNTQLEAQNILADKLSREHKERFQQWNEVVREVRPAAHELVALKIADVAREQSAPPAFQQSANWDIMCVLIEAEFSDVVPPGFFAGQAYWYVTGHFPCGWEGGPPGGRLVLY